MTGEMVEFAAWSAAEPVEPAELAGLAVGHHVVLALVVEPAGLAAIAGPAGLATVAEPPAEPAEVEPAEVEPAA